MTIDELATAKARAITAHIRSGNLPPEMAEGLLLRTVHDLVDDGGSPHEITALLDLSAERFRELAEQPPPEPGAGQLRCSFCGRGHKQVMKLIAGPGVIICDGCIALARQALDPEAGAAADAAVFPVRHGTCSFCGAGVGGAPEAPPHSARPGRTSPDGMAGEQGGTRICTECLDLCDEIIEEERSGAGDAGVPG